MDNLTQEAVKRKQCFNKKLYLNAPYEGTYLTGREADVLHYILCGFSAKKAARELKIAPRTVEHFTNKIKFKLRCGTKNELIVLAIRNGLDLLASNK